MFKYWLLRGACHAPETGSGSGGAKVPAGDGADAAQDTGTAANGAGEGAGEGKKAAEGAAKPGPSDAEARLLRELMGYKNEVKAAKEQLARFEGIDLDQVKALLAEKQAAEEAARKAEEEKLKAAGNFDALKQMMAEAHARETETLRAQKAAVEKALAEHQGTIKELTVGTAFAASKFIAEDLVLTPQITRRVYEDHFEVEGNQVVAYDAPRGAATRTPIVDGRGEPVAFDEALKRIVEASPDRDRLLRSKVIQGAGATNANGRGLEAGAGQTKTNDPTGKDRIAAALAAGGLRRAGK